MKPFAIRGFNPCESLLRHTPEQLRNFIRRMKTLRMNTIIIHYDYGWKRYQKLILEECQKAGIEIILMTFGPRTFLSYTDWKKDWLAKNAEGEPFMNHLACETWPCSFVPEGLDAFDYGARQWLKNLPKEIHHVHMRSADGFMSCQCERCRTLPTEEKWLPFVQRFVQAVLEIRPDLKFETDVYVKRYRIPHDRTPFHAMSSIMYDTFFRTGMFPIGSDKDTLTAENIQYAASEKNPDEPTMNSYHGKRMQEWCTAFPGKIYLHENVMGQCEHGIFPHETNTMLSDLDFYRKIGMQGVCYEAFEPGYQSYKELFELISKKLNGEEVVYEPDALEIFLRNTIDKGSILRPELPPEKYFSDPFELRKLRLYRNYLYTPTLRNLREYVSFALEYSNVLDYLMIGFDVAKMASRQAGIRFRKLSERASDMISRRKLWDFMEDIPESEDPKAVCRDLIIELMEKAEEIH